MESETKAHVISMKIFDFFRQLTQKKRKSAAPIRTVRAPSAPHVSREQAAVTKLKREVPDDPFFDTGELEIQADAKDGLDDPYATYTWEMDPVTGMRRVQDHKAVNKKPAKKDSPGTKGNPYDTMSVRKR